MADGGVVEAALITAAVSAATTAYTASTVKGPEAPKLPNDPKPADVGSFATTQQQAEQAARTAGGTIRSDQNENKRQIGTAPTPPKTLLGS